MSSLTYLLATDGSIPARAAEDFLVQQANSGNDSIIVLGVYDPSDVLGGYQYSSPRFESFPIEDLAGKMESNMEDLVEQCAERFEQMDFDVTTEVIQGIPREEIIAMAEDYHVDSIVMGRSGAGAVTELLLGSTSSYVVHHADYPVTLVP